MTGFLRVLLGALCVAVGAACVVISPNPLTIGCLVFTVLMSVVIFSLWWAER